MSASAPVEIAGGAVVAEATASERPPAWLLRPEPGLCPCGCIGKRRKGSFVEKTIGGGANILTQAIFSEDMAGRPGLLQRIDPRVKLVTMIGLLVATALVHTIGTLMAIYAATFALAVASQVPLGFFVKRVWLFIPIFTGIVVLPATMSFITPGTIVVPLWSWHGQPVGITEQGLTAAGLIVMRVATSISLVVLLTITTPWTKLLAALRALLVPKIFVLVFGMAYRYLFLLLASVTDMYTARTARSPGGTTADTKAATTEGRRFVAASAGALFGKANTLSEEVHMAMVARGFDGDAKTLESFHVGLVDLAWTTGCVAAAALIIGADRLVR